MTEAEFKILLSDIDGAAAEQHTDLSLPENTVTVWFVNEWRKGIFDYRHAGNATGLEHAKMLAGRRHAVIRTTETGRKQIIVWKDGQWFDGYAEDDDE
jgi:hypothetical protein